MLGIMITKLRGVSMTKAKVLMILFASGLLLSGMIVGSAEAKDATGYTISCEAAARLVENPNVSYKQSQTDPAIWIIENRRWYGAADDTKQFIMANMFTYTKCKSKNGDAAPITVVCDGKIVAKTDYTGRPFLLRVMP